MRGPTKNFDSWLREESNELLSMILPLMNVSTEDSLRDETRKYLKKRRNSKHIRWLHHIVLCHKVLYCIIIGDVANAIEHYEKSKHYPASPTTKLSLEVDILSLAERADRLDIADNIRSKLLDHCILAFRWSIDQKFETEPLIILKDSFRSLPEQEFDVFIGQNRSYIGRYSSTVDFLKVLCSPPWNAADVARAVHASLKGD